MPTRFQFFYNKTTKQVCLKYDNETVFVDKLTIKVPTHSEFNSLYPHFAMSGDANHISIDTVGTKTYVHIS